MAMNPQLPFLDLNTSAGLDRSASVRKAPTTGAGAGAPEPFSQVFSQQMKTPATPKPTDLNVRAQPQKPAVERTSKAPEPAHSNRAQERRTDARRSERSEPSASEAPGAKTKPAKASDRTGDGKNVAEDGTTLPPEAGGMPLYGGAAVADVLDEVALDTGKGMTSAGNPTQGLAAGAEAGMDGEGLDLAGLELDAEPEAMTKLKTLEQLTALAGKATDGKVSPAAQGEGLESFRTTLGALTTSSSSSLREAPPLGQYATSVQVPVQDPKWGEHAMNKVAWLTSQGLRSAEIHLNPADLGPIEVKIQMQQDQATVQIQAQNAGVREALEQNVHRLREALAGNGLGLAQFDVSTQSGQQQARDQQAQAGGSSGSSSGSHGDEGLPPDEVVETRVESLGLVNTYV